MAKYYTVTIPIAGHVVVEVEANDEREAIAKAMDRDVSTNDIEGWETLSSFNSGNVCHCPQPWEAEAVFSQDDEEN